MSIFAKRKTLLQNMAFMGVMAAINIIISVASAFSPIASVILVIFLPLTSTLVELFCEDKYFPIYALATFGLSLVATLWNIQTAFFTVLPSLFTGFIFGLLCKKKVHPMWSILIASVIQGIITACFIPIINVIFEVDIIQTFEKAFGLADSKTIGIIIPAFIFTISLIQIVLSYVVVANEIKKFGQEMNEEKDNYLLLGIIGSAISLSILGSYLLANIANLNKTFLSIAYCLLIFVFYFATFIIAIFIKNKQWTYLAISGGFIFVDVFIYALLHSNMLDNSSLLLLGITPFGISVLSIIVSFLKKKPE